MGSDGIVFILLAITAIDLLRFAVKWMPFDPPQYMYPQVKSLKLIWWNISDMTVCSVTSAAR